MLGYEHVENEILELCQIGEFVKLTEWLQLGDGGWHLTAGREERASGECVFVTSKSSQK